MLSYAALSAMLQARRPSSLTSLLPGSIIFTSGGVFERSSGDEAAIGASWELSLPLAVESFQGGWYPQTG